MSAKSVDFRPLPTPEQVRAHGDGGLWEGEGRKFYYKFWDRDRATPWFDCRPWNYGGDPWPHSAKALPDAVQFRPLNADNTPRDWAEIDAIVAQNAAQPQPPHAEYEYRAPTDESATAKTITKYGYNLSRQPIETDDQLRQRCRDAWKAKEKPMATTSMPDFSKLSPEDRARYRAALDAVDPPTTRDAIRSGLEHAPVEIALDKSNSSKILFSQHYAFVRSAVVIPSKGA